MKYLILFGAVLAGGFSTFSYADSPDPNSVTIRQISYAGSGCSAGTVAGNIAQDAQAFTLLFDSFIASAGPGISFSEIRKNCALGIDLRFPSGWSFSIFSVDYRGYANLEPGTMGTQKSIYYFQGQRYSLPLHTDIYGPYNNDYQYRDELGLSSMVWSPCGATRQLNINTSVQVSAPGGRRAMMTVDAIDGQVQQIYHIQWRRCF